MKDIISSESTERLIENGTDKPSGDETELNSVAGSLFYLVFLSMVLSARLTKHISLHS